MEARHRRFIILDSHDEQNECKIHVHKERSFTVADNILVILKADFSCYPVRISLWKRLAMDMSPSYMLEWRSCRLLRHD